MAVSSAFMESMRAQERQVIGLVTIDYTDWQIDQSLQTVASEQANVSYPGQTADGVETVPFKWASMDGSWRLDGSYRLAPGTTDEANRHQMGWWGAKLAGAGGALTAPYPTLTVTHFARPVHSLRVVGDSARGEYPVDFVIRLYGDGNVLLRTENVVGNGAVSWSKALTPPVLDVVRQELEVRRWSHQGRQAKISEFFTSVQQTYEAGDLLEINLLEEREVSQGSLPVGNISANEVKLRLSNADRRFDADNRQSPLYQLLKPNRRVKAWLGLKGEGTGQTVTASIDSQADWQAGTIPAQADTVTAPGSVTLAIKNLQVKPSVTSMIMGALPAADATVDWVAYKYGANMIVHDYGARDGAAYTYMSVVDANTDVRIYAPTFTMDRSRPITISLLHKFGPNDVPRRFEPFLNGPAVSNLSSQQASLSSNGNLDASQLTIVPPVQEGEWTRYEYRLAPGALSAGSGDKVRFFFGSGWNQLGKHEFYIKELQVEYGTGRTPFSAYYFPTATITTKELELGAVGQAATSQLTWDATTPAGTAVTIEASLDGGVTWLRATNGGPVPGIALGTDLTDRRLRIRATLSTANTAVTPELKTISATVNHEELVPLGTFWSLDWQASDDTVEVAVAARDRLELLRKSTYQSSQVVVNTTLYALAVTVLQDAGLTSAEFYVDPSLQAYSVPYAWFQPVSHREALRIIAESALATVYCDRQGSVRVEAASGAPGGQAIEITGDDYFRLNNPMRQGAVRNEVIVTTQPLRPEATQEVYRSNDPVTVPAGRSVALMVYYNQPPVIEAAASMAGAGAGVSITAATYYGWGAEVTIRNTGVADASVTLAITGRPLKVMNQERAVARDAASITDHGTLRYEFPANPLVQTLAQAQRIADGILASTRDARRDLDIDWRGNPALLLGDRVTVKGQVYDVIRQEIDWAGALSARTTGRKATS